MAIWFGDWFYCLPCPLPFLQTWNQSFKISALKPVGLTVSFVCFLFCIGITRDLSGRETGREGG